MCHFCAAEVNTGRAGDGRGEPGPSTLTCVQRGKVTETSRLLTQRREGAKQLVIARLCAFAPNVPSNALIQVPLQARPHAGVAQAAQGLGLDLTGALAGDAEGDPDLFEGAALAIDQPVAQL